MDPKYTRATGGPPLRFRWQSVLHVGFIYKLSDRARSQSHVPRFVILFHYYARHGIGMSLFLLEPSSRKFTKKNNPRGGTPTLEDRIHSRGSRGAPRTGVLRMQC